MVRRTTLAIAFVLVAHCARAADLPDARTTPGAVNPDVSQDNIDQTICVRGWTKTIRPPVYYTNALKKEQLKRAGYADRNPRHYEEDHLVSLELGGSPTDVRNLWPEPRLSEWSSERKDDLENALHRLVCAREIRLIDAQRAIAENWIEAYKQYVGR